MKPSRKMRQIHQIRSSTKGTYVGSVCSKCNMDLKMAKDDSCWACNRPDESARVAEINRLADPITTQRRWDIEYERELSKIQEKDSLESLLDDPS